MKAIESVIQNLARNNMRGYIASDREEAKRIALDLISPGHIVAMGNSQTLRETGIFDALTSGTYNFINQFEPGIPAEENLRRRKQGLLADVYFTSTNAITESGELVNIDGKGNRVAAMLFGPDKVVVVAGQNKIVTTKEAAWHKVQEKTAPELAKRLKRSTPCSHTSACANCQSPERICRLYTVIGSQMPMDKDRIHVILVRENLGI